MRLLVIDGHNLLFQMFFGMPNPIPGRGGRNIAGIIGFVGAVLKLISMTEATHAAVIFDGEGHNPRCELLPEYKANRPDYSSVPDEENPFSALPDIYRALDLMGVCHTEIAEGEADDVIAAYAIRCTEASTVISSYDSDYFQLISDRVSVLRYRGQSSVICDGDYLYKKLGITPSLYASYKCLVGDTADNVAGVRGIGPKTAAALVNTYGSLEDILADTSLIENARYRLAIEAEREHLMNNLKLIRLDGSAELPFSTDEMLLPEQKYKTMQIISMLEI